MKAACAYDLSQSAYLIAAALDLLSKLVGFKLVCSNTEDAFGVVTCARWTRATPRYERDAVI